MMSGAQVWTGAHPVADERKAPIHQGVIIVVGILGEMKEVN